VSGEGLGPAYGVQKERKAYSQSESSCR
jgi:hypothetical protein